MHVFSFRGKKYYYDEKSGGKGLLENSAETLSPDRARPVKSGKINKNNPGTKIPLTHIALFITQQCNLRCIYCYGGDDGAFGNPGVMAKETALRAIEWLISESGDINDISMELFGGEPLLNWPLVRYVAEEGRKLCRGKGKRLSLALNSNATLLDEDKIRYCKEHDISLIISFDGPEHVQNRNRPCANKSSSSYELAVKNIRKLMEISPGSRCRATIIPGTDIDEVVNEIKNIGFKWFQMVMVGRSVHLGEKGIGPDEELLEKMCKRLTDDIDRLIGAVRARNGTAVSAQVKIPPMPLVLCLLGNGIPFKKIFGCDVGKSGLGITVDGDIYPCHRFAGLEEFKLGSIFSKNWNRDSFSVSPLEVCEDCIRCWARDFCGGGCAYVHFASTGSLDKADSFFCRLQRFAIEMAVVVSTELTDDDIQWLEDKKLVTISKCFLDLF